LLDDDLQDKLLHHLTRDGGDSLQVFGDRLRAPCREGIKKPHLLQLVWHSITQEIKLMFCLPRNKTLVEICRTVEI